jgi:hypothetical protein
MVLQERIELSTSPLPRECSTTELLQHPAVWAVPRRMAAAYRQSRRGAREKSSLQADEIADRKRKQACRA